MCSKQEDNDEYMLSENGMSVINYIYSKAFRLMFVGLM